MFNPYPWQEESWQLLVNEVSQDRLPHALLMHGSKGLGKRDFARGFASYLLCEHKNKTNVCEKCKSCRWFQAGSHPDFFSVVLEEKSKSIKVDQLRSLIDSLQKTSQCGGYQVALIESADTMNRAAANALLKTLEEPPGEVIIILVADRLNTLPATIISRCQTIGFSASASDQSIKWLQHKIGSDQNALQLLKIADYAPLRALEYLDLDYFELRDQLLKHLLNIQRRDADPISSVPAFLKHDLSLLLVIMMSLISDMLRLQHGVSEDALYHVDRLSQLQKLAKAHETTSLHEYFQLCQKTNAAAQSRISLNPQLLLENLFIEYYRCCEKTKC